MKNVIYNIKMIRLIISILIVSTVFIYWMYGRIEIDFELPDQSLVMSMWMAFFVFFIGLQYKIEKRNDMLANFLMLFSIIMLIATILGFVT